MIIKIIPSALNGNIEVPSSKSYCHRAIIAASLSKNKKVSKIRKINYSVDVETTIKIMQKWGAKIDVFSGYLEIIGNGGKINLKGESIECNESGSTLRFLIPLALINENEVNFYGKGKLIKRPLQPFYKIFDEKNILYKNNKGELPLLIKGRLKNGNYEIDGDISSQFITGLLYSLPLLSGNSSIIVNKNLESKGYIDLTLEILKLASIEIKNQNYSKFEIEGNQNYSSFDYTVEGDYSQAAFWIVAGLISKNSTKYINCLNINKKSLQGDRVILDIVKKMEGRINVFEDNIIVKSSKTYGRVIDVSQCPDIAPILTVLGVFSKGETRIINGKRLRMKESDRITSIRVELNKLGANIREEGDSLIIKGVEHLRGGVEVNAWNDHRIAMSLAIASIGCEKEIIIHGADSVKKSYPTFWDDFQKLGGIIEKK